MMKTPRRSEIQTGERGEQLIGFYSKLRHGRTGVCSVYRAASGKMVYVTCVTFMGDIDDERAYGCEDDLKCVGKVTEKVRHNLCRWRGDTTFRGPHGYNLVSLYQLIYHMGYQPVLSTVDSHKKGIPTHNPNNNASMMKTPRRSEIQTGERGEQLIGFYSKLRHGRTGVCSVYRAASGKMVYVTCVTFMGDIDDERAYGCEDDLKCVGKVTEKVRHNLCRWRGDTTFRGPHGYNLVSLYQLIYHMGYQPVP